MKVDDLKINQLIEVETDYNGQRVVFSSRIEGIEEESMLIAAPIRHGVPLLLSSGAEIAVQFRARDSMYGFNTVVVGRSLRPIPVWMIKKPVELVRMAQKRHSVRLAINLPVQFSFLEGNDDSVYQGLTVDISAGGLLFSTSQSLKAGERLKVELSLSDQMKISSVARVVRIFHKDEGTQHRYGVAVEFEDITETQRDKIFKFVFDKQREWIRKGLL